MKIIFFLPAILFIALQTLSGQSDNRIEIELKPLFGKSSLVLNDSTYIDVKKDSFLIQTLKFYITDIELLDGESVVYAQPENYYLIDFSDAASLKITLHIPEKSVYKKIKFKVGIDSATNVSGALGGALDPTRGMYWSWQSGYINFKMEGRSNLCNTRDHAFQMHIGGYQYPYATQQTIVLDVKQTRHPIIAFDISKIISETDFSIQHHIMSPGHNAKLFSEAISKAFSIWP